MAAPVKSATMPRAVRELVGRSTPSHTLPTGGAGAFFAGLTVDQFQRRTSVVEYDRRALKKALGAVKHFAAIEGLDAHGHSAAERF